MRHSLHMHGGTEQFPQTDPLPPLRPQQVVGIPPTPGQQHPGHTAQFLSASLAPLPRASTTALATLTPTTPPPPLHGATTLIALRTLSTLIPPLRAFNRGGIVGIRTAQTVVLEVMKSAAVIAMTGTRSTVVLAVVRGVVLGQGSSPRGSPRPPLSSPPVGPSRGPHLCFRGPYPLILPPPSTFGRVRGCCGGALLFRKLKRSRRPSVWIK